MKELGLSQVELAVRSGVSRQTIQGILSREATRVRESTRDRLAAALETEAVDLEVGRVLSDYLRWVNRTCGQVDYLGLGVAHPEPLPVADVYVPLRVRPARVRDSEPPDDCHETTEGREHPQQGPDRDLASELGRHPRVVLLGEPGSGKTTAMMHAAWQMSAAMAEETGQRLPVWIRAAEWAQERRELPGLELVDFVRMLVRRDGMDPGELLAEGLANGNCTVFVDGLDEVQDAELARELDTQIQSLLLRHPTSRFVLSSRPLGWDPSGEQWRTFHILEIVPFSRAQVEHFARSWAAARHGHPPMSEACQGCLERSRPLIAAAASHPRLSAIARNPLMLTMVAILLDNHVGLPQRRGELYAKILDVLLLSWESRKERARPGDTLDRIVLGGQQYSWLLGDLALTMQQNAQTLAPRWWVLDVFERFLHRDLGLEPPQAKRQADLLLSYIEQCAGLLIDKGNAHFGFLHLTFQEFLASQALIYRYSQQGVAPTQAIRSHLRDSRWREVVRLLMASVTPQEAGRLMREILVDVDPLGRFLARGVLLALDCLGDGAWISDAGLLEETFRAAAETGRNSWLAVPLDVLRRLKSLRGSQYDARAQSTEQELLTIARAALSRDDFHNLLVSYRWDSLIEQALDKLDRRQKQVVVRVVVPLDDDLVQLDLFQPPPPGEQERTAWLRRAAQQLGKRTPEKENLRFVLLSMLSPDEVETEQIQKALERLLASKEDPNIRGESLRLLAGSPQWRKTNFERLVALLRDDQEHRFVRAAAARSLGMDGVRDESIRALLLHTLHNDGKPTLPIAAVATLAKGVAGSAEIRNALLSLLEGKDEHLIYHVAHGLRGAMSVDPKIFQALHSLLEDPSRGLGCTGAAEVLADALIKGDLTWTPDLAEKVQSVLLDSRPWPDRFRLLLEFDVAKERRSDRRLEILLRRALQAHDAEIDVAFVFGSFARIEQRSESDVDLFIVGDISLRDLSETLSVVERDLGREINPVIYARQELLERERIRDPFILEVGRKPKIPLIGDWNELGAVSQE